MPKGKDFKADQITENPHIRSRTGDNYGVMQGERFVSINEMIDQLNAAKRNGSSLDDQKINMRLDEQIANHELNIHAIEHGETPAATPRQVEAANMAKQNYRKYSTIERH